MQIKFKFKEFVIFLWKKNAFDCAGIRAQVWQSTSNRNTWARILAQSKALLLKLSILFYFAVNDNTT